MRLVRISLRSKTGGRKPAPINKSGMHTSKKKTTRIMPRTPARDCLDAWPERRFDATAAQQARTLFGLIV